MKKNQLFIFILFLLSFIVLVSCGDITISLTNDSISMYVGDTYEVNPLIEGLDNAKITLVTDNNEVIKIDEKVVTGMKPGDANVKITIEDHDDISCTLKVSVQEKPSITITGNDKIYLGEEIVLTSNKVNLEGEITWSSSDDSVATCQNGKVKALKLGKVVIKATIGDYSDELEIEVIDYEDKAIKINETNKEVVIGNEITLEYTLTHLTGEAIWTSSDDSIATCINGVVKGLKLGKAVIKVTLGDYTDELEITVVKPQTTEIKINEINDIYVGDKINLEYTILPELASTDLEYEYDSEIILISDNIIKGLKEGKVVLTLKATDGSEVSSKVEFNVLVKPSVNIKGNGEVEIDKELVLTYELVNLTGAVTWTSSDDTIATCVNGVVKGLQSGKVTITCKCGEYEDTVEIIITKPLVTEINHLYGEKLTVALGKDYQLEWSILPEKAEQKVEFEVDGSCFSVSETGKLTPIKKGTGSVIIKATDTSNITKVINVEVIEDLAPVFTFDADYQEKVELNWGKTFDNMKGIKVIDDIDGDITDKVEIESNLDNKTYGRYNITYTATDSNGNKSKTVRKVDVVWNYNVTFIGHAGCYYGIMNSEEAFLYAVQVLHYQALECDVKQTKDGVFVVCHDDTFNGVSIADTNYADLKDVEYTSGRNAGFPSQNGSVTKSPYTTKICTLERYLQICKQYNAKAVVEVKSSKGITNSDQSRMQALMDEIQKAGMLSNTILLGSQYNCLIWTRTHDYGNVECQYLVNSCESETYLKRCIDYDLDISINVTGNYSNSEEWLARYKEAGLKISTYTYTQYVDYNVVQEWIDKGVDYLTCDWQLMDKLVLPEKSDKPLQYFTVKFLDKDGNILKEAKVEEGRTAAAPTAPELKGYDFLGWDKEIKKVTSDLVVNPKYQIINYFITYNDNLNTTKEVKWENKAAFVAEFYGDLFNWIKTNSSNISGLTVTNGQYSLVRNGQTAKFSNANDIKAIDIYVFEKTISNFIYKPVVRNSDGSCVIESSEDYFLNSEEYRLKYQALDQWFVKCVKNNYSAYDNTFTPTSAGKIQILFRFQQWAQGTSISSFNTLPVKYDVVKIEGVEANLPIGPLSYTVNDEIVLPDATGSKTFLGWYTDSSCTGEKVTKIAKSSTGNITLYAKWDLE